MSASDIEIILKKVQISTASHQKNVKLLENIYNKVRWVFNKLYQLWDLKTVLDWKQFRTGFTRILDKYFFGSKWIFWENTRLFSPVCFTYDLIL